MGLIVPNLSATLPKLSSNIILTQEISIEVRANQRVMRFRIRTSYSCTDASNPLFAWKEKCYCNCSNRHRKNIVISTANSEQSELIKKNNSCHNGSLTGVGQPDTWCIK